ncbi:MAG: zinc-dependent peptidase [Chitinophagaceae bacterium]|nr:zinc-dependent peptidase [Chitinophagaceae bacterium]
MDIILIAVAVIFCGLLIRNFYGRKKTLQPDQLFPEAYKKILSEHVVFYNELKAEKKTEFESRMLLFLARVRITGVKTTIEDIDRVLIASSAIIPIFGFPGWEYINLNEVLVYPDSFNETFKQEGAGRNTLGIVGTGPYQNIMILSQHELRNDFDNKTGKDNTAIHEFVHLIDKTDGAVDGIPEFLLSKKYILPWLNLMQREIKQIMTNRSDINPYGATDPAEFFAVVAEYFFERPELLEKKHPELYDLLVTIFRQQPQKNE